MTAKASYQARSETEAVGISSAFDSSPVLLELFVQVHEGLGSAHQCFSREAVKLWGHHNDLGKKELCEFSGICLLAAVSPRTLSWSKAFEMVVDELQNREWAEVKRVVAGRGGMCGKAVNGLIPLVNFKWFEDIWMSRKNVFLFNRCDLPQQPAEITAWFRTTPQADVAWGRGVLQLTLLKQRGIWEWPSTAPVTC